MPVSAPAGAVVRILTDRTFDADLVSGPSSGWSCREPRLRWHRVGLPSSITVCVYSGHGDGAPLLIDYRLGRGATILATLDVGCARPAAVLTAVLRLT